MQGLGIRRFDLRDPYHVTVSLSWPSFILTMISLWLAINLVFALLYVLSPGDVANARPGSFSDVFFFSIETLATVGYGVMAPATLYGHIVSATEIVTGTAFTATTARTPATSASGTATAATRTAAAPTATTTAAPLTIASATRTELEQNLAKFKAAK